MTIPLAMKHRVWLVLLVLLTQCASHRYVDYNGWYRGRLGASSCYPNAAVSAQIYDGNRFELLMGTVKRTLWGSVSPDGKLSGQADWTDPPGTVRFVGRIRSELFGGDFTGQLIDGRCNPKLDLAKPVTQH